MKKRNSTCDEARGGVIINVLVVLLAIIALSIFVQ
jgi:hypothetical protein